MYWDYMACPEWNRNIIASANLQKPLHYLSDRLSLIDTELLELIHGSRIFSKENVSIKLMSLQCTFGMSHNIAYLRNVLSLCQVHIRHNSDISWSYIRHILEISQAYLRHVSIINQGYLSHSRGFSVIIRYAAGINQPSKCLLSKDVISYLLKYCYSLGHWDICRFLLVFLQTKNCYNSV